MSTDDDLLSPDSQTIQIWKHIPLDSHYTYEILEKEHIDQVVDVFTRAFCRSEPMTEYLRMDEKKYSVFARAVAEQAYQDGLSIVALDKKRVIAIALVEDIAAPGPIPDFDPKFEYILGLLENLGKDFFSGKKFSPGHMGHLFITAVDEKYRHLGLSKQVNFRAMDLAAHLGFDFMYCELTNIYNEKGIIPHLSAKKRLIGSINYKDFIMKNKKPFANLEGRAHSYLWAIHEAAKLEYSVGNEKIIEEF